MTEATKDETPVTKTEGESVPTPKAAGTTSANAKTTTKKAPARKPAAKKASKKVANLTAEDLVDQKDGSPRPLSAITENLQASVKGDLGRVLVFLSQKDHVGAEPIVLLAEQADELRDIADALDKLAHERLS